MNSTIKESSADVILFSWIRCLEPIRRQQTGTNYNVKSTLNVTFSKPYATHGVFKANKLKSCVHQSLDFFITNNLPRKTTYATIICANH